MKKKEVRTPIIEEEEEEEEEEKVNILHTTNTEQNQNPQTALSPLDKNFSEMVTTSVRLPKWILSECERRSMQKSVAARKGMELYFMQMDEEKEVKVSKEESELELLGREFYPLWREWFVLKDKGDCAVLVRAMKYMKEKRVEMGNAHFDTFLEKMAQWNEEGRFNE